MRWIITSILVLLTVLYCEQYQTDEHYIVNDMRIISSESLAVATIWQEAAGEPYEGKIAVAAVIRNRMKRKYQSDGTVEGTVLRDYQFSGWNTDPKDTLRERSMRLDDQDLRVQDCLRAWKESELIDPTHGAVLYFAPRGVKKVPYWASEESVKLTRVIANHQFYADDGGVA